MFYIASLLPLHSLLLLSPPWPPPVLLLIRSIHFLSFYCHTLTDSTDPSLSSHPAVYLLSFLASLPPSSLLLIQSRNSTSQIDFAAVLRSPINSQIGFPAYPLPLALCISFFLYHSYFYFSLSSQPPLSLPSVSHLSSFPFLLLKNAVFLRHIPSVPISVTIICQTKQRWAGTGKTSEAAWFL